MAYTSPGETRRKVFEFLRTRLEAGSPPTVREVQAAFDFRSVESAREHLEALVREGRLVKTAGKARSYRLAAPGRATRLVPLLGRVQAGVPVTAVEDPDGYVPTDRPDGEELFALRVRGESMTGAGILPGDIVIVRRQAAARPGDIVVALVRGIEDEATVKRLRQDGSRWVLQPENPAFEPLAPDPADLMVLGKVVEVRRSLA